MVDLGTGIGSGESLRGAATCALLCAAAWSPGPEAKAMAGAAPVSTPEPHREEARALAIAPLALGADTGKSMVPTDAARPLGAAPEPPSIAIVAPLGQGDGVARLFQRSGVAPAEAARRGGYAFAGMT